MAFLSLDLRSNSFWIFLANGDGFESMTAAIAWPSFGVEIFFSIVFCCVLSGLVEMLCQFSSDWLLSADCKFNLKYSCRSAFYYC